MQLAFYGVVACMACRLDSQVGRELYISKKYHSQEKQYYVLWFATCLLMFMLLHFMIVALALFNRCEYVEHIIIRA